jgi:hypothetical protein
MKMNDLNELSIKLNAPTRRQQHIDVTGDVSYTGIKKTYRKYKIEIDLYKTFLSVTIHVNSNLALAVNNPDRMFGYKVPFHMDGSPYPVYVSERPISFVNDNNAITFLHEILFFLGTLELSDREGASFYNNKMRFILLPERDIIKILDSMIELINKNRLVFYARPKQTILKKNIPANLMELFPLLKKYAIADDSERAELVEAMDAKNRKELLAIVNPLFPEINNFLNSFKDSPLTHEATLIGNLAELVSELTR